jgi:hypothetical protein
MKILWISRHAPLARQLSELQGLFPGCQLVRDGDTFSGADDIITRVAKVAAAEVVVVAPLNIIRALTRRGLRPLWAEMQTVKTADEAEVTLVTRAGPRHYRHVKFHRIMGVDLRLEHLSPVKEVLSESVCS